MKYSLPEEVDSLARSLITEILVLNPLTRPAIHTIKGHEFFNDVDFDHLENSKPPEIPISYRLQQPDIPVDSLEYFDEDFDVTEPPYERDVIVNSSNESIPNIDSWNPDLSNTSLNNTNIYRSAIVKIKSMFFTKTRGLLLTKTDLVILDITKKKIVETFDLLTIKVEFISEDSFSVGSTKPVIFYVIT